jgi:hypothetical protein
LVNVFSLQTDNLPKTPSYSDVPTTSWAFTYVESVVGPG